MKLRHDADRRDLEYDGVLDQWWIYSDELGGDLLYAVVGMIIGDQKARFPDYRWIRTSKLITPADLLKEGAVAQTWNSRYLLGSRCPMMRVHGDTNTVELQHTPQDDEEKRMFGKIGDDDAEANKLLRTKFSVCAAVGERSERAALAAARMLFGGDLWETIKFMNRPGFGLGGEKPIEKAELSEDDLEVVLNWIGAIEAGVYV